MRNLAAVGCTAKKRLCTWEQTVTTERKATVRPDTETLHKKKKKPQGVGTPHSIVFAEETVFLN